MLLAAFSDVHGNKQALEAVLSDIRPRQPDQLVCLGDLVGYSAFPNEVIETVGAAGRPRGGDPRAGYALVEIGDDARAEFPRVAYDFEAAARAIEATELPREFAAALRLGRY